MSKIVLMPKLGLTMVDGKVAKWHKNEGDSILKGDVLCEVETNKISNSVEATQDGILRKILVSQGDKALVSAPIAIIAELNEDISGLIDSDKKEEQKTDKIVGSQYKAQQKKLEVDEESDYIKASPYAKKLAKDKEIDISSVQASGFRASIIAKDIEDLENLKTKISPTAAKMASDMGIDISTIKTDSRIMKEDVLAASLSKNKFNEGTSEKVEASTMRKVISQRMHESWMTSPRVTYNIEVDTLSLKEMRDSLKVDFEKEGYKLSYNHILMMMTSKVLIEYPYLNGNFDGEYITTHNFVNMGIAVDVPGGLLVPNVKNIDKMKLKEISVETENLIEQAKSGMPNPDTLEGGTFTITNVGSFGIDSFSPIINQPEVAILGINRIVDKPIVVNKEITIRPMMNLSLSADHRLVDGAMASRFLARLKSVIENPYLLV